MVRVDKGIINFKKAVFSCPRIVQEVGVLGEGKKKKSSGWWNEKGWELIQKKSETQEHCQRNMSEGVDGNGKELFIMYCETGNKLAEYYNETILLVKVRDKRQMQRTKEV